MPKALNAYSSCSDQSWILFTLSSVDPFQVSIISNLLKPTSGCFSVPQPTAGLHVYRQKSAQGNGPFCCANGAAGSLTAEAVQLRGVLFTATPPWDDDTEMLRATAEVEAN